MDPEHSRTLFRVDPRLIHAALMSTWVPRLRIREVVVAAPAVLEDRRRRTILELAAMDVVRVEFVDPAELAAFLANADRGASRIVVFDRLSSVELAVDAGLRIDRVNLAHVPDAPGKTQHHAAVFLDDEDRAAIRRLEARGVVVCNQALPDEACVAAFVGGADDAATRPTRMRAPSTARGTASMRPLAIPSGAAGDAERIEATVAVENARGLHLRAANLLVSTVSGTDAEVWIADGDNAVDARSLLGLTSLGAAKGKKLRVIVAGRDRVRVLASIRALFERGFDEIAERTDGEGE